VLGKAGGGVGVVVLHPDDGQSLLMGPLRREVLGMQVARDRLRLDPEHVEVQLEIADERSISGLRFEVSEVR
jgi:hypothetical protein